MKNAKKTSVRDREHGATWDWNMKVEESDLEEVDAKAEMTVAEDCSQLDPDDLESAYRLARQRIDELEMLKWQSVQQIKDGAVAFGLLLVVALIAAFFAWTHEVPGGLVPFMVLGTLALAYGFYVAGWSLLTATGRFINAGRFQKLIMQGMQKEKEARGHLAANHS